MFLTVRSETIARIRNNKNLFYVICDEIERILQERLINGHNINFCLFDYKSNLIPQDAIEIFL